MIGKLAELGIAKASRRGDLREEIRRCTRLRHQRFW